MAHKRSREYRHDPADIGSCVGGHAVHVPITPDREADRDRVHFLVLDGVEEIDALIERLNRWRKDMT